MSRLIALLFALLLLCCAAFFPAREVDAVKAQRRTILEAEALRQAREARAEDDVYVDTFSRPYPMSGGSIFRWMLVLDALAIGGAALLLERRKRPRLDRSAESETAAPMPVDQMPARWELWAVMGITLVAAGLRLYGASRDLWLDEITTVLRYTRIPLHAVLLEATTSNNHLLNSLLCAMLVKLFGAGELVVRLPAILFGIASVPLLYGIVRMYSGARAALLAAGMLALSYHHVFFSQNARGYSGFLFGALLGTYALLRAIREDRPIHWALTALGSVIGILSLLMGALVTVSQVLVVAAVFFWQRKGGRPSFRPAHAVMAFAGAGWVIAHAYGMVVPDIIGFVFGDYRRTDVGWRPSAALAAEFLKGIPLGPMTIAVLLLTVAVAGAGVYSCARRSPLLAALLALPVVNTILMVLLLRSAIFPRFFLFALPVGIVFAARGVVGLLESVSGRLATERARRRFLAFGYGMAALVTSVGSAWMLRGYYAVPKQDYRGARIYVQDHRAMSDVIVAVGTAGEGYRLYWPEATITNNVSQLEALMNGGHRVWVLYSFEDDMLRRRPRLLSMIRTRFEELKNFPATVPGGNLHVCRSSPEVKELPKWTRR